MGKKSAGILFYRLQKDKLEVLLVHPGGPYWANKDLGAWSIPKGEFGEEENPLDAAIREVHEELGIKVSGNFIELTPLKQKSGKLIFAWALKEDFIASPHNSNTFEIEWPPRSGNKVSYPEIDKASWFDIISAKQKINQGQLPFLLEIEQKRN